MGTRRTRAAGVDEQGRRLDSGQDPDQHSLDDKDVLPAYDRYGGPPKYMDLEMALDNIFYHPNVAPFVSTILIQQLVTSNPTPAYVARVSAVFNDNGQDRKSVV